jgi:hypothetical protein
MIVVAQYLWNFDNKKWRDSHKSINISKIIQEEQLLYRNIKNNKGSKTVGTNFNNILMLAILIYIMENPILNETTEYKDNRISLYVGQKCKCSITGEPL